MSHQRVSIPTNLPRPLTRAISTHVIHIIHMSFPYIPVAARYCMIAAVVIPSVVVSLQLGGVFDSNDSVSAVETITPIMQCTRVSGDIFRCN